MFRAACCWLCIVVAGVAAAQELSVPMGPEDFDAALDAVSQPFIVPRSPDELATAEPLPFEQLELLSNQFQQPTGWSTPLAYGPDAGFRGRDHVGAALGIDPAPNWPLLTEPVYAWHAALDQTARGVRASREVLPAPPLWLQGAHCRWQTSSVNWRYNSMYLAGCMPEGYYLQPFIETVPGLELYTTPLEFGLPLEPGGSQQQAAQVDGRQSKSVSQISLNIKPQAGPLPDDRAQVAFAPLGETVHLPGTARNVRGHTKYWQASLLNHQPLYFEDINLERHGYSYGVLQPVVSGTQFFATLPALPYLMTAQPPQTTRYTLGETRPGNHASYIYQYPPLNADAAIVQAGVVTGLYFIIP